MKNKFNLSKPMLVRSFGLLLIASSNAYAGLDQNCVVNIMNRTIQVEPGGGWSLPNVPSNMGQVRARATCIKDGVTTAGQTDYFSLVTNLVNQVPEIKFENIEPVPVKLGFLRPTTTVLNGAGTIYQVSVSATYQDASVVTVTPSSSGINYISSNPAVATVTPDGLVTAVSSGNVLVTARKDGVVTVKQFTVITSGDLDQDGLPDDYEVANGLNPNDPVDAFEDEDRDMLSALQEYDAGTNPSLADTDGDGINDGEETVSGDDGYITNPLLSDTDGDGISDFLELIANTDPSDLESYSLNSILSSISVSPEMPRIIRNLIYSESSEHLKVTGHLVDGSELDITSKSMGTEYTSGDISIVNFGAVDGEVFAGNQGETTVSVSNNGLVVTVPIYVEWFAPSPIAHLALSGNPQEIVVRDNFAYIAAGDAGLHIVDVSYPFKPVHVKTVSMASEAVDVVLKDSYAVVGVAGAQSTMQIVNISNPGEAYVELTIPLLGQARSLSLSNDILAVATGSGFYLYDVTQPANPVQLSYTSGITANTIAINKDIAIVATRDTATDTISIYGIGDPTAPVLRRAQYRVPNIWDVKLFNGRAHIAAYWDGYRVLDVTNPDNPVDSAWLDSGQFILLDIAFDESGQFAFFADSLFASASPYIDITNIDNPIYSGIIDFSRYGDYDGKSIDVRDGFVYMTRSDGLVVGQYRKRSVDEYGIAPSVKLLSPVRGQYLYEGEEFTVEVDAFDDVSISYINVYWN